MNLALSGDCCYTTQRQFIDRMIDGRPFETNGHEYFKALAIQEVVYESASKNAAVSVSSKKNRDPQNILT
jgi:hypothetical protein